MKKARNNARKSLKRQLERAEKANNISEIEAIKIHRMETALGNFRKCVVCQSNYIESSTLYVNEEDEEFSFLREKPELKRMGKFSICVTCSKRKEGDMERSDVAIKDYSLSMKVDRVPGGEIYSLKTSVEEEGYSADENAERTSDEVTSRGSRLTTVMFPVNVSCAFPENEIAKPSAASVSQTIYRCKEVSLHDIGTLYFNQIAKYRAALDNSKIFTGSIEDENNKILTNLQPFPDDFKIRGSDKWYEEQTSNNQKRFQQLGQSAFRVEIEIPLDNKEAWATNMLNEGICITVTFTGDDTNEVDTQHWVHLNHTASSPCKPGCKKMSLTDYLKTRSDMEYETKFISSYLSSVFLKMKSFVANIIKCPSSELFAEEFSFTLAFDSRGVCHIVGFIWPAASLEFNEAESLESFFGQSLKEARETYLSFVGRVVTCSSDQAELLKFGLNKTEASKVVDLAIAHQIPATKPLPQYPSLVSMFMHSPGFMSARNIQEAEKLRREIKKEFLDKLTNEEINDLSTAEWLQEMIIERHIQFEDTKDGEILFKLNSLSFNFILDKTLTDLIIQFDDTFCGIYHYAISCAAGETDSNNIVLRRRQIMDCYTNPYNPFILRAMLSPVAVSPVYGYTSCTSLKKYTDVLSEEAVSPQIVSTHKQISLTEAFSLSDSRKFRDVSTSPVSFCNTNPEARVSFTRVPDQTEKSYTVEGKTGYFEICYNVVARYQLRINGNNLLLAEVASHYEFAGKDESEKIYPLYQNNLDKIRITETESISGDVNLPELILCSNGQVLKKRKTMKILNYPAYETGSDKFKYSRILLFYPLAPGEEVTHDDLDRLFFETNDQQPLDKYNQRLTIIENNERKLFKHILCNK